MSDQGGLPWESGGDLPWDRSEVEWEEADADAWRSDLHQDDWPESLAGPEYWLYKRQRDE